MTDINIVFGTRPEAIKLAPVILALKSHAKLSFRVILTGQHREMTKGILDWFGISGDVDLDMMEPDQSLGSMTSRGVNLLNDEFSQHPARVILTQGDTTSAFMAALVGFYHKARIGHVEAGLRTMDKYNPWPEEMNRKLISQLADFHFAPTERNVNFLRAEGIDQRAILKSGNTVIDALLFSLKKINSLGLFPEGLKAFYHGDKKDARVILITGHRRENFGEPFRQVCEAIKQLAGRYDDTHFIYPVHLNPNVRKPVYEMLGHTKNIHLIDPLGYSDFVSLMTRSYLILTDSGGVQEEAPSLHKPVVVFRETTERPEAVESGMVNVVGTNTDNIVKTVVSIIENPAVYAAMSHGVNPYGDGRSAERIVDFLVQRI